MNSYFKEHMRLLLHLITNSALKVLEKSQYIDFLVRNKKELKKAQRWQKTKSILRKSQGVAFKLKLFIYRYRLSMIKSHNKIPALIITEKQISNPFVREHLFYLHILLWLCTARTIEIILRTNKLRTIAKSIWLKRCLSLIEKVSCLIKRKLYT